jgi:hypothetical protein
VVTKSAPLALSVNQSNAAYVVPSCCCQIYFNILPSMSSSPKCSLPLSFCDQNIVGLWLSLLCMLHSPSNVILVLRTLNNNNNKCTSLINITMQRHNPLVQLEPTFSVLHPISVSSSRLGISFLYVTSMNLLPSLSCSTVRGRQSQITD